MQMRCFLQNSRTNAPGDFATGRMLHRAESGLPALRAGGRGGPKVNPGGGVYCCVTMEGSFRTSYLLSRQTGRGVVYTDGKMPPPPGMSTGPLGIVGAWRELERARGGRAGDLRSVNMRMADWQGLWPFDSQAEYDAGIKADDAAMKANRIPAFISRFSEVVLRFGLFQDGSVHGS